MTEKTEIPDPTTRTLQVLEAAVRIATGLPHATPRPGQIALSRDLADNFGDEGNHHVGGAPTGVGKSLSALSALAVAALDGGHRGVISTESLSLLSQYADKDAPTIAKATEEVIGRPARVAVLKGWSNYVSLLRAAQTACEILGIPDETNTGRLAKEIAKAKLPNALTIEGFEYSTATLRPLLVWALNQDGDDEIGDRSSYPGMANDFEWGLVSVSPAECLGEKSCPLYDFCRPAKARQAAAEADIVITNHSMIAVQAATATPVVIGSQRLGQFHNIVVDEAHTLPSIVRSQGQAGISGKRLNAISRRVGRTLDERDRDVTRWVQDGQALVEQVDQEIRSHVPRGSYGEVKVPETTDPLEQTGVMIENWLGRADKLVSKAFSKTQDQSSQITVNRIKADIDALEKALKAVREHHVGVARWLEPPAAPGGARTGGDWAAVQSAPVNVGWMLDRNVWNVTEADPDDSEEEITRPLSISAISATIPTGFPRDAGLATQAREYESPFDSAYASSRLFIPRADSSEAIAALGVPGYNGKTKFDTKKHTDWAIRHMIDLVNANSGHTLVLSANAANGKAYADRLREAASGRWNVYSQWDGENVSQITAKWRGDHSSVLVGTRSLMTGTDAPGETCSLVIIDRAPRAAGNPVDDARVELIQASIGDRWSADRMVYVSDATLLLEQSAGRLIRSMSDAGMVAVLDPRLLKVGPFTYPEPTRAAYMKAFRRFAAKTADTSEALSFLTGRRALAAAA